MSSLQRVLRNPNRCQDVIEHRLVFCETAGRMSTTNLLLECWCCRRFFAYCCACTERRRLESSRYFTLEDEEEPRPCHYYKVVFVDGACLGNGQHDATAGIGIAIGVNPNTMQWAIPVDDDMDPSPVRTSQRAELLAAIYGIRKLAEYEDMCRADVGETHSDSGDSKTWVITSDSEYVVLGMTEWVPTWKRNGWRNSSGRRPKNLDLFRSLESAVERYEHEYNVQIAFWRISRNYNAIADELAGCAARGHIVGPVQFEEMYYPSSDDELVPYSTYI